MCICWSFNKIGLFHTHYFVGFHVLCKQSTHFLGIKLASNNCFIENLDVSNFLSYK